MAGFLAFWLVLAQSAKLPLLLVLSSENVSFGKVALCLKTSVFCLTTVCTSPFMAVLEKQLMRMRRPWERSCKRKLSSTFGWSKCEWPDSGLLDRRPSRAFSSVNSGASFVFIFQLPCFYQWQSCRFQQSSPRIQAFY